MKLPDPNASPEEIAEQIMLGAVLDLPADGIVRWSSISRELDRHAPLYMLGKLRAMAIGHINAKLRAMGFKPMHPGAEDWRQT